MLLCVIKNVVNDTPTSRYMQLSISCFHRKYLESTAATINVNYCHVDTIRAAKLFQLQHDEQYGISLIRMVPMCYSMKRCCFFLRNNA